MSSSKKKSAEHNVIYSENREYKLERGHLPPLTDKLSGAPGGEDIYEWTWADDDCP